MSTVREGGNLGTHVEVTQFFALVLVVHEVAIGDKPRYAKEKGVYSQRRTINTPKSRFQPDIRNARTPRLNSPHIAHKPQPRTQTTLSTSLLLPLIDQSSQGISPSTNRVQVK
jgi:hypothetical protein